MLIFKDDPFIIGTVALRTIGDWRFPMSQREFSVSFKPYQLRGPCRASYPKDETAIRSCRGKSDVPYAQLADTFTQKGAISMSRCKNKAIMNERRLPMCLLLDVSINRNGDGLHQISFQNGKMDGCRS